MQHRLPQYDVTNTIRVSDPRAVGREVRRLLRGIYPDNDLAPVERAFEVFTQMYAGTRPGYHGCDTWYHDVQHSLDCTLALARLIDGHERSEPKRSRIGERRARLGIICALFHDVGYLRRHEEEKVRNGAELTLCHVTRSGDFLAGFLPTVGFAREAAMARRMVHYTGYEMPLEAVRVRGAKDRRLGFLLGTADLMAQMADRAYPEKCHRFLYSEFEACGLAGPPRPGKRAPVYDSPEDLLRKTPEFARKLFQERLDGYFGSVHRYVEKHFGGENLYLVQIRKHLAYIRKVLATGDTRLLRRQPKSINAHALRRLLGIKLAGQPRGRKAMLRATRARRARARASGRVPA
jgi:hypothetical protein